MQDDCSSPFLLTVTTSSFHRCDSKEETEGGHENEITQRIFHFSVAIPDGVMDRTQDYRLEGQGF